MPGAPFLAGGIAHECGLCVFAAAAGPAEFDLDRPTSPAAQAQRTRMKWGPRQLRIRSGQAPLDAI